MASPMYVWDGGNDADGLSWATAYQDILDGLTNVDVGGILYVASEHSQTQASALSLGSANGTLANPVTVISVDKDNSDAYLAMRDDAAPGKIETTGNNDINITNSDIYIGVTLDAGDDLSFPTSGKQYNMIDCKFMVDDNVNMGWTGYDVSVYWKDCVYEQITGGTWAISYATTFIWDGGTFSFSGGFISTNLLTNYRGMIVRISDVDFQDLDGGDYLATDSGDQSNVLFKRCKVPAALGGLINVVPSNPSGKFRFHSVSNSDIIYHLQENYYEGQINEDTATYFDATYDGTNGYSIKMVSTANSREWTRPLRFKLAEVWASANPTLTVELNTDNVVFQDDEFWVEIEYPDSTTGALGGLDQTSRPATIETTPANLTTSTAAWTEAFGTEKPQKIEVTIANGQEGVHTIWACLGKASTTAYVCPKVAVS